MTIRYVSLFTLRGSSRLLLNYIYAVNKEKRISLANIVSIRQVPVLLSSIKKKHHYGGVGGLDLIHHFLLGSAEKEGGTPFLSSYKPAVTVR